MLTFERFDLKITKLTGNHWDRDDLRHLSCQLMEEQGNPRYSIENRIFLVFDRSPTSHVKFFEANRHLLLDALISISRNPYECTYWLEEFQCWTAIKVFSPAEYQIPNGLEKYQEHPIGLGLRETDKAEFEKALVLEVAPLCNFKIKPWKINPKAIGIDGELKIDSNKLRTPKSIKQLEIAWR
jgi:hypothetical protein